MSQEKHKGAWIRMFCNLTKSDDVAELCRLCHASITQASRDRHDEDAYVPVTAQQRCLIVGALHAVWSSFYTDPEVAENGSDMIRHTYPEQIDDEVGIPGFARAMEKIRWLDIKRKTIIAIDLRKQFGQVIEVQEGSARRSKKYRDSKKNSTGSVTPPSRDRHDNVTTRIEENRGDTKTPPNPQRGSELAAPRKSSTDYSDQFREFCDAYPSNRREGLQRAFATWTRDGLDEEKRFKFVMKALAVYKESPRWKKDGGMYIEKMSSWLRNRKYRENPPTELNEETES